MLFRSSGKHVKVCIAKRKHLEVIKSIIEKTSGFGGCCAGRALKYNCDQSDSVSFCPAESSDMRQAYLFEENGRWYAYEHSANRIEKFVKGFVDFKHKVQDVCGRIKVEIDLSILEKCSITLCEDSLLVLDCPAA